MQNAIAAAAAAAPPKESNSVSSNDPGSSSSEIFPSGPADQVPVPATSPEIEPRFANQIPAASSEVKAPCMAGLLFVSDRNERNFRLPSPSDNCPWNLFESSRSAVSFLQEYMLSGIVPLKLFSMRSMVLRLGILLNNYSW